MADARQRQGERPPDLRLNHCRVFMFPHFQDLAHFAAERIREQAWRCVKDRGVFTLALSGGSTPSGLYRHLGQPGFSETMPWDGTHVFWGDERMVPRDSEKSNFKLAWDQMLSRTPIPESNIHPMVVDRDALEENARLSEQSLRSFFGMREQSAAGDSGQAGLPEMDLVLLGLGGDGHTASLFPGSRALEEDTKLVAAVPAPDASPQVDRVSLTLPVLNKARSVFFLVSGEGKHPVLRQVLGQEPNELPAGLIRPREELIWLVHPPLSEPVGAPGPGSDANSPGGGP